MTTVAAAAAAPETPAPPAWSEGIVHVPILIETIERAFGLIDPMYERTLMDHYWWSRSTIDADGQAPIGLYNCLITPRDPTHDFAMRLAVACQSPLYLRTPCSDTTFSLRAHMSPTSNATFGLIIVSFDVVGASSVREKHIVSNLFDGAFRLCGATPPLNQRWWITPAHKRAASRAATKR